MTSKICGTKLKEIQYLVLFEFLIINEVITGNNLVTCYARFRKCAVLCIKWFCQVKYLICLVVFVFITNLKKKLFNSEFLCNKICQCVELIQVWKDLVYSFIYKTVVLVLSAFCSVSLLLHNVINVIIYSCELICTVLQKIHFCHVQLT